MIKTKNKVRFRDIENLKIGNYTFKSVNEFKYVGVLFTGEWRRLHNKQLHALYSSPNIIRVMKSRRLRWAGHVARMGEGRGAYRALVGKPEGRRPLGRHRRR
jgi:hypothetical protein